MFGVLSFDGNKNVGPDVSNVVYLWCENNVPVYVGITNRFIHHRHYQHLVTYNKPAKFQHKLRANPQHFTCYIVAHNNSYKELKSLEKMFIKQYNTYWRDNPNGCNMTLGGDGCEGFRHSETCATITKMWSSCSCNR